MFQARSNTNGKGASVTHTKQRKLERFIARTIRLTLTKGAPPRLPVLPTNTLMLIRYREASEVMVSEA
jgi:hypothetical protein